MLIERTTTGHPKLPVELFHWVYTNQGYEAAIKVLDMVQADEMSIEDVRKAFDENKEIEGIA